MTSGHVEPSARLCERLRMLSSLHSSTKKVAACVLAAATAIAGMTGAVSTAPQASAKPITTQVDLPAAKDVPWAETVGHGPKEDSFVQATLLGMTNPALAPQGQMWNVPRAPVRIPLFCSTV